MIKNSKFKNKNSAKGITLIEILVVMFIIAIFSSILVADFPKMKRQFALTRAVYKMSQDLRRAQDMGLSGLQVGGINAKGYGVYINLNGTSLGNKKYIIYADVDDDQQYTQGTDFVVEETNLDQIELGVIISAIDGTTDSQQVDINFKPPNPTITITSLSPGINQAQIIFALEFDPLKIRMVLVNTAGLIEIR